jgi:hypothetical protein
MSSSFLLSPGPAVGSAEFVLEADPNASCGGLCCIVRFVISTEESRRWWQLRSSVRSITIVYSQRISHSCARHASSIYRSRQKEARSF